MTLAILSFFFRSHPTSPAVVVFSSLLLLRQDVVQVILVSTNEVSVEQWLLDQVLLSLCPAILQIKFRLPSAMEIVEKSFEIDNLGIDGCVTRYWNSLQFEGPRHSNDLSFSSQRNRSQETKLPRSILVTFHGFSCRRLRRSSSCLCNERRHRTTNSSRKHPKARCNCDWRWVRQKGRMSVISQQTLGSVCVQIGDIQFQEK